MYHVTHSACCGRYWRGTYMIVNLVCNAKELIRIKALGKPS